MHVLALAKFVARADLLLQRRNIAEDFSQELVLLVIVEARVPNQYILHIES